MFRSLVNNCGGTLTWCNNSDHIKALLHRSFTSIIFVFFSQYLQNLLTYNYLSMNQKPLNSGAIDATAITYTFCGVKDKNTNL